MLLLAFVIAQLRPDAATIDFKQPQLAVDERIVAVAFGGGNAVYFSGSSDRGFVFSKPVKVAEAEGLMLGRHRGPRIALTPQAVVVSAIAKGDLTAWRSIDGGNTWSGGVRVNDVPDSAREGLHAMAAGADGLLYAAWLDLRGKGTKLYGAYSKDGGRTWSPNVQIYASPESTICECCHPSVIVDAGGAVSAMWRNSLKGSRDMYLAQSTDGGRTFRQAEKLGAGTWPLKACPMDGGGIAVNTEGRLVSVWRRDREVFLATADGAETRIGTGKDPAIAAGKDGVYAAWSGTRGLEARIPGRSEPVHLAAEGGYVQLAAMSDGSVIAAWETKGIIHIRTVR